MGLPGVPGVQGSSGTSGVNGGNGTSGTSGVNGGNGTSGTSGVNGNNGTSGTSGVNGNNGTSGTSGVNGGNGTSGTSGTSGANGGTGSSGTSGTSGTGFSTISSAANNRVLTSDGSANAAVAEANLSFDGTALSIMAGGYFDMYRPDNVAYAHIDVRASGNNAIPHKYTYNTSTGTYQPYTELWWDSDSYHSLGVDANVFKIDGSVVWNAGNDGAGSGLDADLLDGQHGSYYAVASSLNSYLPLAGGTMTGTITGGRTAGTDVVEFANADNYASMRVIRNNAASANRDGMYIGYGNSNSGATRIYGAGSTSAHAYIDGSGNWYRSDGNIYWHAGNDGAGSGLDADVLDGVSWGNVNVNITTSGYVFSNGESLGTSLRSGGIYGNLGLYVASTYNMQFDLGWAGSWVWTFTNSARMSLSNGGNLVTSGNITAYGSPSDERYKYNIKPIQNALTTVLQLEGVTFNWKEDTDSYKMTKLDNDVGFIAQQVREVLPDLVREGEDGYLGLRERAIVPLLVEAIKELNAKIEKLEGKTT
jgi:hypothetical protein